jgi:hypothetical protein
MGVYDNDKKPSGLNDSGILLTTYPLFKEGLKHGLIRANIFANLLLSKITSYSPQFCMAAQLPRIHRIARSMGGGGDVWTFA